MTVRDIERGKDKGGREGGRGGREVIQGRRESSVRRW